jgi:diguanylate cyclase (GGDEF)-like protein
LTGLANRSLLEDRVNQSIFYASRSKRIVAVLLLDLDRFKRINDTFGHSWGDQLLKEVAGRLSQSIRDCDTVARFGGDEFVIVLAEVAEFADIGIVNKKILENLSQPVRINDHEFEVSTSIGISFYPENGQDAESLIQKADLAMFQAKQAGGNTFRYFSPEMTARAQEMISIEAGMREALKKEEFLLHYQPKVDLQSGHITGCEALVRWQHPEKGLLSPGYFIPAAEETGLILPLGKWILESACRQAKTWEISGFSSFSISVNVSARQFRQENFVEQIYDIMKKTGVEPGMISLEITESMVMEDIPNAVKIMARLKELGLGLQLDDFGTGFSNFNSLRKFQVDCLKIDSSFIADALTERSAAAVVQSIIAIAHNLGLTAVAEGVETQKQLDFLVKCKCDEFQGYLFSKPLPAEEFIQMINPEENMRKSMY